MIDQEKYEELLKMYTGKTYSEQQIPQEKKDVEEETKSIYMDYDEYQQLKNQKVWVRFCHAESSDKKARNKEKSRVEYEPILVRLEDALKIIPESEWKYSSPYQFSPEQSVDSIYYSHNFTTPGYPSVGKTQKGIIKELKEMGHNIYQDSAISNDIVYVKPVGEPDEKVTAHLIEIWIGEYKYTTKKFGLYTGKAYSKQQINEAHVDVEKAYYKDTLKQKEEEIAKLKKNNLDLYNCIQRLPKIIKKLFIKDFNIKLLNKG